MAKVKLNKRNMLVRHFAAKKGERTRFALNVVSITAGETVASNGQVLARVSVPDAGFQHDQGLVTADTAKLIEETGSAVPGPKPDTDFPNWGVLWPQDEPVTDIIFDTKLLKRVIDAAVKFSDRRVHKTIRLRFYKGWRAPVRFDLVNSDGQEMNGLMMPMHGSEVEPKFAEKETKQTEQTGHQHAPKEVQNSLHYVMPNGRKFRR